MTQRFALRDGQADGYGWWVFERAVRSAGGTVTVDGGEASVSLPVPEPVGRPMSIEYESRLDGLRPGMTAREVRDMLERHDTKWGMDALGCSRATYFRRLDLLRNMPDDLLDLPYAEAIRRASKLSK